MAVFIELDTVVNRVFSVLPMVVRAPMAATETRSAMKAVLDGRGARLVLAEKLRALHHEIFSLYSASFGLNS
jgi:hypothetical protein